VNVGLTFDLRTDALQLGLSEEQAAEFDSEATIEALEGALRALGHHTTRIGNLRALIAALSRGERWDAVFNIVEGYRGYGRESAVPAVLEDFGIPCTFSDPLTTAVTLHKGFCKRVMRDAGVPTTPFRVVAREADLRDLDFDGPWFVKPVAEGTAKGVRSTSRVLDRAGLWAECARVIETYRQPALVEPFLPGREFTTCITGEGDGAEVIGSLEVILLDGRAEPFAYTFVNKEECESRCEFPVADPVSAARCAEVALAAWRALGCRDAGRVDLREDAHGELMVLELNPLPGMHPSHSDLPILCTAVGLEYVELVRRIIDGALARASR
jgi:D-alanine-D-alanine ligase